MYADQVTESMRKAIAETERRRKIQEEYNKTHGIEPQTIYKSREEILKATVFADSKTEPEAKEAKPDFFEKMELEERMTALMREMKRAASQYEFEKAALFRDEISKLKSKAKKKRVV
jgi:excinuclease ABC subunit B